MASCSFAVAPCQIQCCIRWTWHVRECPVPLLKFWGIGPWFFLLAIIQHFHPRMRTDKWWRSAWSHRDLVNDTYWLSYVSAHGISFETCSPRRTVNLTQDWKTLWVHNHKIVSSEKAKLGESHQWFLAPLKLWRVNEGSQVAVSYHCYGPSARTVCRGFRCAATRIPEILSWKDVGS